MGLSTVHRRRQCGRGGGTLAGLLITLSLVGALSVTAVVVAPRYLAALGFDNSASKNILPLYPLIENHVDLKGVYTILNHFGLKPPSFRWQSLFEEVQLILQVDLSIALEETVIDILFAGRSQANCFFCFNQRAYEIVWLAEAHFDLFAKMWWLRQSVVTITRRWISQ